MDLSKIIIPQEVKPTPMVTCTIEGILEEADLRELSLGTSAVPAELLPEPEDPTDLKRVREKHHHVARLIASGLNQRMVSQICGYTESYLSILLNNPAMIDLVEMYRIQTGAGQQLAIEKLKTIGLKAAEKLEDKIDNDQLTNDQLLGAAKLGLDRGGLGPTSTQHQVTEAHVIDHARLAELNKNARTRNGRYIVSRSDVRDAIEAPAKDVTPDADS